MLFNEYDTTIIKNHHPSHILSFFFAQIIIENTNFVILMGLSTCHGCLDIRTCHI